LVAFIFFSFYAHGSLIFSASRRFSLTKGNAIHSFYHTPSHLHQTGPRAVLTHNLASFFF